MPRLWISPLLSTALGWSEGLWPRVVATRHARHTGASTGGVSNAMHVGTATAWWNCLAGERCSSARRLARTRSAETDMIDSHEGIPECLKPTKIGLGSC